MSRRTARNGSDGRRQLDLFAERPRAVQDYDRVAIDDAPVADAVATTAGAVAEARSDRHPDQDARDAVKHRLDRNLLVEAGAGAGKTFEMVTRMVALVRSGKATVDQIAAVTFTRKAAAELRERFQTVLERELRSARAANDGDAAGLDRALREIDRAFIGTIHSFCARLLRERPLDAGLDPEFRETLAAEKLRLTRDFWNRHIERLAGEGDPSLEQLEDVGLQPRKLYELFKTLTDNPDVDFPADLIDRPDPAAARAELEDLLDEARALMPDQEPVDGWDDLQKKVRTLSYHQRFDWSDDLRFLDAISQAFSSVVRSGGRSKTPVTKKNWRDGDRAAAFGQRLMQFASPAGTGGRLLVDWYAHRYPFALAFARRAAQEFATERRRRGTLFFEDLLMLSAKLLRHNAPAREELASRYPYLLVDEFQDTDPLQAEVLFLLAGDPGLSEDPADWRTVVPRPGALFVVGDPKQSIYRFRRADISLYNQVKQRFTESDDVLELTSNFRSGPLIGEFVNHTFRQRFTKEGTEHQAQFARMLVRREAPPRHAVAFYTIPSNQGLKKDADLARADAELVASWIAGEVERGGRKPSDFMVLTHRKKLLEVYARAVEARNLPVQVTGAGIGIELELRELKLLLEALADPGDARLTVAVLVGLFFGLDYEQLAAHAVDHGGAFNFVGVTDEPKTVVEHALTTLNEFWRLARKEPADVVVARIMDRLGLLPFAAAGGLADSRAGALLFVLEAVRAAALNGEASLTGALDAIETALETDEAEAPLVPARDDAVRIMNLHQAKGLEASVVVLAEPFGESDRAPILHVRRSDDGQPVGYVHVIEKGAGFSETTLARPRDWGAYEAEERKFEDAEDDRKLYVAATRARDTLLVGSFRDDKYSPWGPFFPHLLEWPRRNLSIEPLPDRERLEVPAADIEAEVEAVDLRRRSLAMSTCEAAPVKQRVKRSLATVPSAGDAEARVAGRGPEWGTAVHRALEAIGRGLAAAQLRATCRALLIAADRPLDAEGEPRELDELARLVESVAASSIWARAESARAAGRLFIEVPFALRLGAEEYAALLSQVIATAQPLGDSGAMQIVHGVIDLAFLDDGGWVIVDYKSDVAAEGIEPARLEQYRAQVGLYAAAWQRLTGQPVRERVILFTESGETVCW